MKLLGLNIEILKRDEPPITPLQTIFLGGGTPSLLSARQLESIFEQLEKTFGFAENIEISLEANPGTLSLKKLQDFRHAGANRLSLGIQSMNDQNLQLLGRIHTATQARQTVNAAQDAGFDNLNLDLIFALPDQSPLALLQEITALLELSPEHISLYGLSFEPGTTFFSRLKAGELSPCPEEIYAEQYLMLHEQLCGAGFEHYEISNFSVPGKNCRHNQGYWQRENCLAIGVGAHSFYNRNWGERWHIPANLQSYKNSLQQGKNPAKLLERFDQAGAMREAVYLALRTSDGINLKEFEQRYQLPFQQVFAGELSKIEENFTTSASKQYRFNVKGWLLYDHLISYFL